MTFNKVHDWYYLAQHLGIDVTADDLVRVLNQLEQKNLMLFDTDDDEWLDDIKRHSINEVGIRCYYSRSDVKEDIMLEKTKEYIHELSYDILDDNDYNDRDVKEIRAFVEQFVDESIASDDAFFSKLLELDDYLFLKFLSKNLDELWW